MDIIDIIHRTRLELWSYQLSEWYMHLFTMRWWFILGIIAIAYAIWWKYVDKRRLTQILLFGSFIAVFRVILDDAGSSAALWLYSVKPLPLGHALFLNDLTVVPLAFMLIYQYCRTWKNFFIWSIIAEAGFSFAFLPLLIQLDVLRLYHWQLYYTFFIMLTAVTVMRAIILTVIKVERNSGANYSHLPLIATSQPALKPMNKNNDNNDID